MARTQSKTATSSAAPAAAPAATTTTKKAPRAAKKVETPVVAPAPVVEAAPAAADVEAPTRESRHKDALAAVDAQIASLKALRASLVANYKADGVELKAAQSQKGGRRQRKPVDPNAPKRAPSGITKPAAVSDEICSFMGVNKGTLVARTEVTKYITNYIKQHNLKDTSVPRKINPDSKLQALLSVPTSETLTYFNLQKYLTKHFPKKVNA